MGGTHSIDRVMTGYYDYVLGAIPLTLLGITGLLTAAGVSLTMAVPPAAGIAVLLIGHAMFVNGPVDTVEAPTPPQAHPVNAD